MATGTRKRKGLRTGAAPASAGTSRRARDKASGEAPDLAALSLKEAAELLRRKGASPVELTQACLRRIERHDAALNTFITLTSEQALKTAREMEREQRHGKWRGPLHGIPVTLKDNIDTELEGGATVAVWGVLA